VSSHSSEACLATTIFCLLYFEAVGLCLVCGVMCAIDSRREFE